jgi:hypothetical protein
MAGNAALDNIRKITLRNVKIHSADRRSSNPHDGITRLFIERSWLAFLGSLSRTVITGAFMVAPGSLGVLV